jgi:hypothetical protein
MCVCNYVFLFTFLGGSCFGLPMYRTRLQFFRGAPLPCRKLYKSCSFAVVQTCLPCSELYSCATGRRSRPRRPWNRQKQAVFLGGAARPQYSSAFVVRPPVLARTRIRGDGTPTAATGSWNRSPAPALLFGRMPEEKNVSLIRQLLWIR